jgi:hypothetical protein
MYKTIGDLLFALSVNFLLYCALIIVFYLLLRFYLEEETFHQEKGYELVNSSDTLLDEPEKNENNVTNRNKSPETTENEEVEGNFQELIQKVAFCALGLTITFSIWGLVQERILTQPYDKEHFEYSYGLVFLNRLGGLCLSIFLMYYFQVTWIYSPLWEYSFPSVANMLSSWCQYEALKYVR